MIIPVIDLKNGEAVSGKSGKRDTYTPLKSVFHNTSDPIALSRVLKKLGFQRIYAADLDAIEGTGLNLELAGKMNRIIPVMLDSGLTNSYGVQKILETVDKAIVATETIESFNELEVIFSSFPKQNLVLSIDVMNGKLLSKQINADFKDVYRTIEKINPLEIILLDISRVGTKIGADHEFIKNFIRFDTKLILGGGLTSKDIEYLNEMGVQNFLVGTALHSGSLNQLF
jgi:phosphoribosylformimino-5-aminoimidazole carboxamide ribotide isomerase